MEKVLIKEGIKTFPGLLSEKVLFPGSFWTIFSPVVYLSYRSLYVKPKKKVKYLEKRRDCTKIQSPSLE